MGSPPPTFFFFFFKVNSVDWSQFQEAGSSAGYYGCYSNLGWLWKDSWTQKPELFCSVKVFAPCFLPWHPKAVVSAAELTAASCHLLSCSLPRQGVEQLVSAGTVCLNVYSALCLCWKKKDQSVCFELKMEAAWWGTSSHSWSHTYVHVCPCTCPCPSSPLEPRLGATALKSGCSFRWRCLPENQAVPLDGHQRSGLPLQGSRLNLICD